jgi:hypothetical protein
MADADADADGAAAEAAMASRIRSNLTKDIQGHTSLELSRAPGRPTMVAAKKIPTSTPALRQQDLGLHRRRVRRQPLKAVGEGGGGVVGAAGGGKKVSSAMEDSARPRKASSGRGLSIPPMRRATRNPRRFRFSPTRLHRRNGH